MSELFQSGFRLGNCSVDPKLGYISRPDGTEHVTPKAMEVLLRLVEAPEALVEREVLIRAGWGDEDGHEEALTRCIAELRQALGDHHDRPEYIQTIPRRGYRLVAPVRFAESAESPEAVTSGDAREPASFWDELIRRDVVRTSLAYAALAWLVIEVVSLVGGIFEMPTWILRVLVVMAFIGLPIVVALSWAVQQTPKGLALDMPVDAGAPAATSGRKVDMIIIATLIVAVSFLVYREFRPDTVEFLTPENSVAVLAFDTISDNVEDEYLGYGLAEELLNLLAQTENLDVTSRKASFYYKDKDIPLTEIIAELGVRNIVEGSVQRSGERIRITVQLIDGPSLTHRWSETYDTSEPDLISIRDTVAGAIATELHTAMTARGQEMMVQDAAIDRRAFMLYLKGRGKLREEHTATTLERAKEFFADAVAIDEEFVRAHAGLCDTYLAWFVQSGNETAYFDLGETACNRALSLDDDLVEVYTALGNLYRVSGQLGQSLVEFEVALTFEPDNYDALYGHAQTLEASGDLEGAESQFRELSKNEPGYWHSYNALGNFFYGNSRYAEAAYNFQRVVTLDPQNALAFNNLGAAQFMQGEYSDAAASWEKSVKVRPSNLVLSNIGLAAYYAGEFDKAADMQVQAIAEAPEDYRLWGRLGDARRHSGAAEAADTAYGAAMRFASRAVELNPTNEEALRYLSLYYSYTGDNDAAIQAIDRAGELQPETARIHYFASKVYLGAGDLERAIQELELALTMGYSIEIAAADPDLRVVRESGRVQMLVGEPKT
ncbi:MAG: tetratricopeptide repeat protein [Woeseiaceae bacterium]|nr:tetratricopeptide repeat protein [Woeseiaceae bacterium]MDX2608542.1 tetratricopeptide repeat protein [Woeseiaceae bacterium]